ncbi:cache domain-containing sensor histidine kinase [Paenibacillus lentus]|uniref:HAMP domain-containing protein n=1 Tax=Paenibacillus lentus TaxID=1338368 RepID=A0A3Q8SAU8_9BACL|nr:sensor histidine kinase [Paenibacillus lentus]AZK46314.1 HAMP domain-containing protein [Paenibacillus lentus]
MKWNSIRTKLIVFMLIATIIPIVATMFVTYLYTTQSLRTRAVQENANLLYQGQRNLAELLSDLNRSSSTIYSNAELFRLLEGGYDDPQSSSRVYAALSYISTSIPDIYQVYLYENVNRRATLLTLNTPKRHYDTDPYEDILLNNDRSLTVQKTHMSHIYGFAPIQPNYPPEPVFTLHRKIEKVPSSEVIGYLAIDVKLSALTEIVEHLYEINHEKVYILDQNGAIVYSDDESQLGLPLESDWYNEHIAAASKLHGHFEQDNNVFIYQRLEKAGANWVLVKQIPVSYLNEEANKAVTINLLLLAISLMVIAGATIFITLRITAPIKQLNRYMNQIQSGNLNVDIQPASNDEIGAVMLRFRSMMDTINNLILREYKLELANKTNQLRAMQAQINPHFLNNTLQIIGTLALELKMPRIYALLSALAKMMHYSMHNEDKNVTLRDELEHVKAYIELQKERFENRFQFHYDVDDSLLDLPMPKMILQPIVENYFKHGLDRTAWNGEVMLFAKRLRRGGQVEIVVQNNGAQIPEIRLKQLQEELSDLSPATIHQPVNDGDETSRPSIGLANVLARLQLVNGDNAALAISNLDPVGVQITLIIPDQDRSGV